MTVYLVTSKVETEKIAAQFDVLYLSRSPEKARAFFDNIIQEDPTGFLKKNGVYACCEDYVESNYIDGGISYQILKCELCMD